VTWLDMKVPNEVTLANALKRLLATVVVSDSRATRSEDQLRELLHVLLVKLESDATASKSSNQQRPVAFQVYGDKHTRVHVTASAIRQQFKSYFARQRTRIFHPDDRDDIIRVRLPWRDVRQPSGSPRWRSEPGGPAGVPC
jgi:hypothetical protein